LYHPEIQANCPCLGGSLTTQNDGVRNENRRRTPRYAFIANAQFSDTRSGARFEARVSEIGLNGCYLETPNPPAEGAQILVKIFKESEFFESAATVAYTQPGRGMGLRFDDVNWHFLPTLQKWLLEAMRAGHG
jgi:PilZ domain